MSTTLSDLPPEMRAFTILKTSASFGPRLGSLALPGRITLETPHYLGNTSRGAVSHISQDNFRKNTSIGGVYVALEDFVEKLPRQTPPLYQLESPENSSSLRDFIALPKDTLLVVGARRIPCIPCPTANTNSALSIYTSVGFRQISAEDYAAASQKIRPDIVVGLADIPYGQPQPGLKRIDKMSDRTEEWTKELVSQTHGLDKTVKAPRASYQIFAPILPLTKELQTWYLDHLIDDMLDDISGLAIYDAHFLADLPAQVKDLPRLSFDAPSSPGAVLYQISLGMDIFTIPFITEATDAGISLDFTFPPPKSEVSGGEDAGGKDTLGVDMWQSEHALSVTPLSINCSCYACTKHHRAYVQHLLSAKEMLGWVLIQIHNHAIMDSFFAGIRESIARGTFDQDKLAFEAFYEPELPEKSGQGPRVRGYQFKSGQNETKKNPAAYKVLNVPEESSSEAPTPDAVAADLEKIGFAETAKP
ncbi:tRNA-guanine transglycosylase [Lophium mytilinum]|uniref:Queuine tRNA-ribosyltransferase accessory subunit 2 n=1 Tax=Lophium mytilinum TaxID=390894 RepID=A0A6A6QWG0_9PEZI|nr:tRNA-guanine transglycosylase [Lophium mytilinum]